MSKWTAEQVQAEAHRHGDHVADMLYSYAATLDQPHEVVSESQMVHAGWQRRIKGDSGKWLKWNEYWETDFPEKVGRWTVEYREVFAATPLLRQPEPADGARGVPDLAGSPDPWHYLNARVVSDEEVITAVSAAEEKSGYTAISLEAMRSALESFAAQHTPAKEDGHE